MDFRYKINRSRRAKNIRLSVHSDTKIVLTIPWWVPETIGRAFLNSKKDWLMKKISEIENRSKQGFDRVFGRKDYLQNKEKAREFVLSRLRYYNDIYGFNYGRISIRDTKSRWGSCSAKGNLNFSYKLLFLPQDLADYVIVHELCHLQELNHSKNFWALVGKCIPQHKSRRKRLKNFFCL
ncbi:DUF45 domain-containing protein [Candidatus Falkowbacteria bacterium]|nr:DUF45 domain-containing protein [Candidatus Falkowbacteria bacterium]